MWAVDLGTADAARMAAPGMMGTHSTGRTGAGTATEECGR
jgi:hypothetical protein